MQLGDCFLAHGVYCHTRGLRPSSDNLHIECLIEHTSLGCINNYFIIQINRTNSNRHSKKCILIQPRMWWLVRWVYGVCFVVEFCLSYHHQQYKKIQLSPLPFAKIYYKSIFTSFDVFFLLILSHFFLRHYVFFFFQFRQVVKSLWYFWLIELEQHNPSIKTESINSTLKMFCNILWECTHTVHTVYTHMWIGMVKGKFFYFDL